MEQNMAPAKSNKGLIIVVAILAIALIGVGVYAVVAGSSKDKEIADLKTQVSDLKKKADAHEEEPTTTDPCPVNEAPELDVDTAQKLIQAKEDEYQRGNKIDNVEIISKGKDNYYWVGYRVTNQDGNLEGGGNLVFDYGWTFNYPGFSGYGPDFMEQYGFEVKDK